MGGRDREDKIDRKNGASVVRTLENFTAQIMTPGLARPQGPPYCTALQGRGQRPPRLGVVGALRRSDDASKGWRLHGSDDVGLGLHNCPSWTN